MAQPVARVKHEFAAQPSVNHHANALNRQRRFCHGRGKHHLAFPLGRRGYSLALAFGREIAVKRKHTGRQQHIAQRSRTLLYLSLTGQEHEDIPFVLSVRLTHRAHSLPYQFVRTNIFLSVNRLYGKHPPLALNKGRTEFLTNCRGINRGGHHHDPEVGTQYLLRLASQGKRKVGVNTPFMKLIKHHAVHPFERRVINKHPREDAFRQHLNARLLRHFLFKPHAVAHRLPHGLTQQRRHTFSYLPRRQTPRFKHKRLAASLCTEVERQGKERGLTGPGRRGYHCILMVCESGIERRGNRRRRQRTSSLNDFRDSHACYVFFRIQSYAPRNNNVPHSPTAFSQQPPFCLKTQKIAPQFCLIQANTYLCIRKRAINAPHFARRDGRVVDYSSLENYRAERHRGFESLSLRNKSL